MTGVHVRKLPHLTAPANTTHGSHLHLSLPPAVRVALALRHVDRLVADGAGYGFAVRVAAAHHHVDLLVLGELVLQKLIAALQARHDDALNSKGHVRAGAGES